MSCGVSLCCLCSPVAVCGCARCFDRGKFWVEIGNEQGLTDSLVHDVVAVSGAMQEKAKQLKLPFNLSFVVGGNGWVPKAFTPMMQALAPGMFHCCVPRYQFLSFIATLGSLCAQIRTYSIRSIFSWSRHLAIGLDLNLI